MDNEPAEYQGYFKKRQIWSNVSGKTTKSQFYSRLKNTEGYLICLKSKMSNRNITWNTHHIMIKDTTPTK